MEHINGHPSSGQGHKTAVFITGFNLEVTGSESIGIPDESDLEETLEDVAVLMSTAALATRRSLPRSSEDFLRPWKQEKARQK